MNTSSLTRETMVIPPGEGWSISRISRCTADNNQSERSSVVCATITSGSCADSG